MLPHNIAYNCDRTNIEFLEKRNAFFHLASRGPHWNSLGQNYLQCFLYYFFVGHVYLAVTIIT
jgi:hypothetical protein